MTNYFHQNVYCKLILLTDEFMNQARRVSLEEAGEFLSVKKRRCVMKICMHIKKTGCRVSWARRWMDCFTKDESELN